MIRILMVLCLMAVPLRADPLPQGDFMLGSSFWSPDLFGHYVTLRIDGTQMTVELSNPVMMNDTVCMETGVCTHVVDVATAQLEGDGLTLNLTNVDIFSDLSEAVWSPRVPVQAYAEPLLAALRDSAVLETDDGFALTTASGPLQFFRTDAATREIIRAYPLELEVSIRDLAGCEVRELAVFLSRDDLSPAEETFRLSLQGFAHMWRLRAERAALDPLMGERDPANQAALDTLTLRSLLPQLLALSPDGPMAPGAIETIWSDFGRNIYPNNRTEFDAEIASYGDVLVPLAAFRAHVDGSSVPIIAQNACTDFSFGFIAAQGR